MEVLNESERNGSTRKGEIMIEAAAQSFTDFLANGSAVRVVFTSWLLVAFLVTGFALVAAAISSLNNWRRRRVAARALRFITIPVQPDGREVLDNLWSLKRREYEATMRPSGIDIR